MAVICVQVDGLRECVCVRVLRSSLPGACVASHGAAETCDGA